MFIESKAESGHVSLFCWRLDFREMMLIFGLMLLLQTAACLDRSCSFDQSVPCYAALGDKLNLLMVDAREYDLQIKKRINDNTADGPVCRVKNDNKKECDLYNNRTEVTVINGTVIINRVNRSDSGNYRLTLTDSDGSETSEKHLQVIVEAPIGSVEVSIICSSNQRSVFCSSDGDHIIYNLTKNGEILEQGPMNGNTTIQLNEETDGDISCSVKNHVSHAQKTIRLKPCPGPTTAAVTPTPESVSLVCVVVRSLELMVLFGLLGAFHIYMRHTTGKKEEDEKVRMRRFRERHEHTAEDS